MSKLVTIWIACSFAAITTPAGAQPVSADSPQVLWRISAGRDAAGLRDIARTNIPVDASPVQWRGTGLGLFAQHSRERGRWRQEFSAAFTRATEFHYEVGDISTPRPSDDQFTRADLLYALHRRLFSDVGIRGVSLAAGLRLGLGRTSVERHVPVDLTANESRISAATAFVVTVGFRRGRGPGVDVEWSNGGHVGRLSAWHSSDQVSRTQWGGGWQTDLAIEGDIPIGRRTSVVARYFRSNDGVLSSHRSVASARSSVTLGVMYGR